MSSDSWNRPVFIASMGRSGSTLLQRVLNIHPQLTIWGEHGGALNGIAATCRILAQPATVNNLAEGNQVADTVIGLKAQTDRFDPWVSAFTADDFLQVLRRSILELFTKGLDKDIRWGFKEIRYDAQTMRVLMEMFPESQLILLARDLEGQVSSHFFRFGRKYDLVSANGQKESREIIDRFINSWLNRYEGLLALSADHADRCFFVAYQDLAAGNPRMATLFRELGEVHPAQSEIDEVFGSKTGSSFEHNSQARHDRVMVSEMIQEASFDRGRYGEIAAQLQLLS